MIYSVNSWNLVLHQGIAAWKALSSYPLFILWSTSVAIVGIFIMQMLYIYWCSVWVKAFDLVWLN